MRTRYFISFNEGRAAYDRTYVLLKSVKCLDGLQPRDSILAGNYQHTFDSEDSRLAALRRVLEREGVKWSERRELVYTDDELRTYSLLEIVVASKPLEGSGPVFGTQYDLSQACLR
jgi:hypothetical protein